MRSGGQNPQAGLSAQNWAALSLFIQQSFSPSFVKIELEKARLADFVLVFQAKRIICESKSKTVSYGDIRGILDSVTAGPEDEILVICRSVKPGVMERLDNAKYFPEAVKWLVEQKKFKSKHLSLLKKLNFWVVDRSVNEEIAKNLLEQRFNLWLPNNDLVHELLVEKIYKQSASGGQYTREQLISDMDQYREKITDDDDSSTRTKSPEVRVKEILDAILDPGSRITSSANPLGVLIASPGLHSVALDQLKKMPDLDLKKWSLFWDATYSSYLSRQVFSIIKEKVVDLESAKFAVEFVKKHAPSLRYKFNDEFQYKEAAELLETIRKYTPSYDDTITELLTKFYRDAKNDVFYIKKQHGSKEWILGELAESIKSIYNSTKSTSAKKAILDFIFTDFNLIQDDSKYWHETPPGLVSIVGTYAQGDPVSRLPKLIKKFSADYDSFNERFTNKKPAFSGWDFMGGGTNNFGGDYSVEDRTFIGSIIIPAMKKMPAKARETFIWSYVETDTDKVSHDRPDFMNRAAIPFLMDEYVSGTSKEQTRETIKAFIKATKGIPNKRDLIYQIVRDAQWPPEEKWELLKIGLDEFRQPVDIFMDQILWQLLEVGHEEALKTFANLLTMDSYMGRQFRWESTVPEAITRVIKNKKTLDRGVGLLKSYLDSDAFQNKLDTFDAYDLKATLLSLIDQDEKQGFGILLYLIDGKPTRNQQAAFSATLRDMPERLQEEAYAKIVDPMLTTTKNALGLSKKLTAAETRESIVWFGEKLAKRRQYIPALRIAKFFMDDPDPKAGNSFDQQIFEGKVDQQITTVRGCLPWILMQFSSVEGREYIPEIFKLTKLLCEDVSIYVRSQTCLTLEALANNRHTHMPNSPEDWFMPFELATSIEQTAMDMLHNKSNHYPAMMKLLARVILRIHTLSEEQALDTINSLMDFGDEEVQEALAHLLIYMAEFREDDFKQWPKSRGKFANFKPAAIKSILEDQAKNGKVELKRHIAFELAKLPEESKDDFKHLFGITTHYAPLLAHTYDHLVFESLYRFIGRYLESNYDECYKLWRKCLRIERPAIEQEYKNDKDGRATYAWWPYFYNGAILEIVAKKSFEAFLSDFEYLVDYPENVIMASDIEMPLAVLRTSKSDKKKVDALFKKLISRNPKFFEDYQAWLDKSKI